MMDFQNNINRRQFLQFTSGSAAAILLSQIPLAADETPKPDLPNFLWISCEDISPDLGCYGDTYAVTPNIDNLAAQAVRYTNVFAHAPVCAPARSGIITGMYPTTIGAHNMRCQAVPPPYVKCFSEFLRAVGYYCTNNKKTDYQFDSPVTAWDENSEKAHWRNRAEGQPFFSVFNLTTSHESQIRNRSNDMLQRLANLKADEKHDPAKAVLPPYYPDTEEVRRDWTQYYDIITLMDKQVADILRQLQEDGLADSTIVWFWSDHGRGLPRAKRWVYDSGIHVPLIIKVPQKFQKLAAPNNQNAVKSGTVNDDLISFIDFAPTMLSLAGIAIPPYMQGRAFLGQRKDRPHQYVFAARDRMDEAYDIIRAVRDKRYKYIRNYMPHLPHSQDIEYMNLMPTMQQMRRLNAEGKLQGPQKLFFERTKPVEELYDTLNDPHEVNNLAANPNYKDVLERMRRVHIQWSQETSDIGLIPEPELDQMKRPGGKWQKTAAPNFVVNSARVAGGGEEIAIICSTVGASIAYKIEGVDNKDNGWKLYTRPVKLERGRIMHTKACQLGFRDSNIVHFQLSDTGAVVDVEGEPEPTEEIPYFRDQLDKTDLLKTLRQVKDLDSLGEKALPTYIIEVLKDRYASVRYWGAIGLHYNCCKPGDISRAKGEIKKLLTDDSVIVRIAAAHTLCDWGEEKMALPVLVEALKDDNDKARLFAAIALNKIGDKAKPALDDIRAGLKDSDEFVQRVTHATLKQLNTEAPGH